MIKQIPNAFTLLNLIFGCMAIVAIVQNGLVVQYDGETAQTVAIPEKIWLGSLFIMLAAMVDFLDGFVARALKASSELGLQLDSLADVVSFGVAPSMIVYEFLRLSYASHTDGLQISTIVLIPAFLIAAFGAYRLARFNISAYSTSFTGVPIPAIGLLTAALPMIYWNSNNAIIIDVFFSPWFWYVYIVVVSYCMVSTLPMLSLKFSSLGIKENLFKYILIAVSLLSIILLHWLAAPVIFISYIILSLLNSKK